MGCGRVGKTDLPEVEKESIGVKFWIFVVFNVLKATLFALLCSTQLFLLANVHGRPLCLEVP